MARAAPLLALVALALSWPAAALAQETGGFDFVLRGTHDPFAEVARPSEPAAAEAPPSLGPAMAGPATTSATTPASMPPRRPPMPRGDEAADPFAPPGIALGSFVLQPTVDIGVTATDNVHLSRSKRQAVGLLVAPNFALSSDWARHEVALVMLGAATFYDDDSLNELEGEVRLSGRYDVSARTDIDVSVGAFRGTEAFTDPDLPAGAAERPAFNGFEAAIGASHRLGRVGLRLAGEAERVEYEDVALVGGGNAGRDDRNYAETALRQRAGYSLSPALEPFIEAAVGRVDYDQAVDSGGFRRSSAWRELVGGIVFNLGPKLSGEVAAGYRTESFDDPRLEALDGVVASAALLWSPRRLTEVRFELSTETSRSTIPGVAGSFTHTALVAVERRIRKDLALEAGFFFARETFVGVDLTEDTLGGYAELAYDLNRYAALVGRYEYERLDSSDLSSPVEENVISVRVRLRR